MKDTLEGCRQQNPQSQEELYKACYPGMIKLCARYARDMDEAGTLYNEAMLKVFTMLHQYNGSGDFMAWIRRIVVNTCIDHCRKEAKFTHKAIDLVTDKHVSIAPEIYNRFSAHEVMHLLRELPGNTALVFNLFVLDGFKHEEIGQMLNIATGTSKWHLNEARRLLKIKLDTILKKEMYANAI